MSENLMELNEISFDGFLPPEAGCNEGWSAKGTTKSPTIGDGYLRQLIRSFTSMVVPKPGISSKFLRLNNNSFGTAPKFPQVLGGMTVANAITPGKRKSLDQFLGLEFLFAAGNRADWREGDWDGDLADYPKPKGLLIMKSNNWDEESHRRARVHAIASGSEKVFPIPGLNRFIFVNSPDRIIRAKKILHRFGYTLEAFLFRFDPDPSLPPHEFDSQICHRLLNDLRKPTKSVPEFQ